MPPPNVREKMSVTTGAIMFRQGAKAAKRGHAALEKANTKVAGRMANHAAGLGTVKQSTSGVPAIRLVNSARSGIFEPGGQYEVAGHGFGRQQGEVFIRFAGTTLHCRIDHWSEDTLFVGLEPDIAGVPDATTVELLVGVRGSAALRCERYGFRAARAELRVPPSPSGLTYDKGQAIEIAGQTVWTCMPPDHVQSDGEFLNVARATSHSDDSHAPCFGVGFDRIRWNIPLNPGFEVVGYEWYHDLLRKEDVEGYQFTRTGKYNAAWDGDDIRIDYGVQRRRLPPFALVGGSVSCSSGYKVALTVNGPRGLPAL